MSGIVPTFPKREIAMRKTMNKFGRIFTVSLLLVSYLLTLLVYSIFGNEWASMRTLMTLIAHEIGKRSMTVMYMLPKLTFYGTVYLRGISQLLMRAGMEIICFAISLPLTIATAFGPRRDVCDLHNITHFISIRNGATFRSIVNVTAEIATERMLIIDHAVHIREKELYGPLDFTPDYDPADAIVPEDADDRVDLSPMHDH